MASAVNRHTLEHVNPSASQMEDWIKKEDFSSVCKAFMASSPLHWRKDKIKQSALEKLFSRSGPRRLCRILKAWPPMTHPDNGMLITSVCLKDFQKMKVLLEENIVFNFKRCGKLHFLLSEGQPLAQPLHVKSMINLMCQHGADPNQVNADGKTVLDEAIGLLLEHGSTSSCRTRKLPVHVTVSTDDEREKCSLCEDLRQIINTLVENGARKFSFQHGLLERLLKLNCPDIVRMLLASNNTELLCMEPVLLTVAIKFSEVDIVRLLLSVLKSPEKWVCSMIDGSGDYPPAEVQTMIRMAVGQRRDESIREMMFDAKVLSRRRGRSRRRRRRRRREEEREDDDEEEEEKNEEE